MKKTISMLLALVMVLGLLPAAVFATGTNNVYISVSFDGQYIDDQNGSPIVYVPVSLDAVASVDLNEYGLSDYLYDPDGDGNYETTALQLVIYAHENIYGGDWSDVTFTGGAGSSYFQGGIFGFTENLNYFLNGEFPIDEALSEGSSFAVGATSDHIVLEAGDFIDIASFTSFAFLWDSAAGFHLFADENDGFVHSYTAKAGKAALYDYSDVTFDTAPEADEMTAILGLPEKINEGDSFNAVISTNQWDNEAGYKLIDFIVNVPDGLTVTDVTASDRLAGGEVLWNLEVETGKLRVVYFDANENTTLTVTGEDFPAELFTIAFKADIAVGGSKLDIAISGMSVKLSSDSADEAAMIVVNTEHAKGTVTVVEGISFSAVCLYTGDDVDLIPATRKAVAVAVTGISGGTKLRYNDGTHAVEFKYSAEISEKTGVSTYVALVDVSIPMEHFVNDLYFTIPGGNAPAITFGDSNGDGILNAQDALAAVDAWLRKGEAPDDDGILTMNVNGDSRINTFDALGIVEKFVSGSEYGVVTKAATITTNQ